MTDEPDFATFQSRVGEWVEACLGDPDAVPVEERVLKFVEEAMELAQAAGCPEGEARRLVGLVFSRPAGALRQEAGGTMTTFAALCLGTGIDMREAGESELADIWTKIDAIRARRNSIRTRFVPAEEQEGPEDDPVPDAETRLAEALARMERQEGEIAKIRDEVDRLAAAIAPFARYGRDNTDDEGWTCGTGGERIRDWFGPSEFRRLHLSARAVGIDVDADLDPPEGAEPEDGMELLKRALRTLENERAERSRARSASHTLR